ncbi:hypothetical protein AWB85_06260 [Mycobacteroides immunogenum]|uniref:Uncharacterized protein n=1 Tax=Mycobacteroides immunogenum TaxID=83262 RepID=A0A179VG91_9MYCO|nr:hypothetical protein [Mycobacteroides immunogenum]OAT70880.1 hypothetical protein AWB85_06260 [Mycobacteroides immunogenum]
MADYGYEILHDSKYFVTPWGPARPAINVLSDYLKTLDTYQDKLRTLATKPRCETLGPPLKAIYENPTRLGRVDEFGIPAIWPLYYGLPPAKDGSKGGFGYWEQADINIKAVRDTVNNLNKAGANAEIQQQLIDQTLNIGNSWQSTASEEAIRHYLQDKKHLAADIDTLNNSKAALQGTAENIEVALDFKASSTKWVVDRLLSTFIKNSPADFDARLKSACINLEWWQKYLTGDISTPQPSVPYQPEGQGVLNSKSGFWSPEDICKNLSDWVLTPISLALDNLDQINNATDDHLKKVYGTLMMALNYGQP